MPSQGAVFAAAWLVRGGPTWWFSILTVVIVAVRVITLYVRGGKDTDEGALAGSRADERQKPPLHEPGQPIDLTARINRRHAVQGLISEYRPAAGRGAGKAKNIVCDESRVLTGLHGCFPCGQSPFTGGR
jgi:hypothetical protein